MDPIDEIIRNEGSRFTWDPHDHGGPTKYGITQATLSDYLRRPASVDDVRNLTEQTAREIYERKFLVGPRIDTLPEPLRVQVLDIAVNSGPGTAVKMLQRVLGMADDGVLGPATRAAVAARPLKEINNGLVSCRELFYRDVCQHDPSQSKYLAGWLARAHRFMV